MIASSPIIPYINLRHISIYNASFRNIVLCILLYNILLSPIASHYIPLYIIDCKQQQSSHTAFLLFYVFNIKHYTILHVILFSIATPHSFMNYMMSTTIRTAVIFLYTKS